MANKQNLLEQADLHLSELQQSLNEMYKGLKSFTNQKQRLVHDSSLSFHKGLQQMDHFINSNSYGLSQIPLPTGLDKAMEQRKFPRDHFQEGIQHLQYCS